MCVDPVSLSAIGATLWSGIQTGATAAASWVGSLSTAEVLTAAGTAVSAGTSYAAQQAEAKVAAANAANVRDAGYANELAFRDKARRAIASQTVALGNRGLSLSSGTPLDLLRESAKNAELDAQQIRANAGNAASAYAMQGASARLLAPLSAGTRLLSGGVKLSELGAL